MLTRYLLPKNFKVRHVLGTVRTDLDLKEDQALYVMNQDQIIRQDKNIDELYNEKKAADDFLYLTVTDQSAFGC